jgi:cytochrome c peroxidase
VSELNEAGNPVLDLIFTNPDGTQTMVSSPDPGRALITGSAQSPEELNAFKIPTLWGAARTAQYFHDNSAATLEDVLRHYAKFFALVTNGQLVLSEQDQADAVAYMKRLK